MVKSIPECVIVSVNVSEEAHKCKEDKNLQILQKHILHNSIHSPWPPSLLLSLHPDRLSSFPYSRTYLLRPFLGALVLHALGRDGGNSCSYNMRLLSLTLSMLSLQQTHQVKKAMYMHHSAKQMGLGLIFFSSMLRRSAEDK